jgi:hypothetical protein
MESSDNVSRNGLATQTSLVLYAEHRCATTEIDAIEANQERIASSPPKSPGAMSAVGRPAARLDVSGGGTTKAPPTDRNASVNRRPGRPFNAGPRCGQTGE